jgi:transposase
VRFTAALPSKASKSVVLEQSLLSHERILTRLEIVALHENGMQMKAIAWQAQCNIDTVRSWCERSESTQLNDHARSGRPAIYAEEQHTKLIAFYCQIAPLPGCQGWTLRWAEKHLRDHPELLGISPSRSTLQRVLRIHHLRPHLRKYFLQITDPDFFPKMEHLIAIYLRAPEYLFCFDECPGIQALKHSDPSLPPTIDGNPIHYKGFDYKRNGTVDLMAFLRVGTGEVFGRCTPNHTTQTLCKIFREHVEAQPKEKPLHYVMDNLSPHYNNEFCALVAELSEVKYEPLATGKERRAWLQKENKRIVVHFTPFHGSWLNMVEIWFGILGQKSLKDGDFGSGNELIAHIEAFLETWNTSYAHPFTWAYQGQGLHDKVVERFNRVLEAENPEMESGYLRKQLELLSNLIDNYRHEVPAKTWKRLQELAIEKRSYLEDIINNEPKPRTKSWAQAAMATFTESLEVLAQ